MFDTLTISTVIAVFSSAAALLQLDLLLNTALLDNFGYNLILHFV